MKKKMFGRLGAAAVALTLITTCMMSGTLAKYTSTASKEVTVKAAAWKFSAKQDSKDLMDSHVALDLGKTTTEGIIADADGNVMIAPGASGEFKVELDNSASEVEANYAIKIAAADGVTGNAKKLYDKIEFKDESGNKMIANGDGAYELKGTAPLKFGTHVDNTNESKKTVTIKWSWPEGDPNADPNVDADDTAIGVATDNSVKINVAITGTQVAPTPKTN